MAAPRPTVPSPLFADSPVDQFRRGWQHATSSGDQNGRLRPQKAAPVAARTPRWHWWALLLITLFAGVIRFAWLDRPSIWGDESVTFMRVVGTYDQLLEELANTRFMPLHYQALWLLGHAVPGQAPAQTLNPHMMRLIPAVAGTLMVPAMYFLARQLVNRRAALLTALFTACSAYLFVYSRDAKMYMHFWLFLTLNMACFLWWLRTRSTTGWLGWIAAGSAACGLHMTALGVIAIQPIMLLTHRRAHWIHAPLFLLGLAMILAGPLGYYYGFNRFGQKIEEHGWNSTGIQWVALRNKDHGATVLSLDSAAAYLFAYNYLPEQDTGRIPEHIWNAAITAMAVLVVLFGIGALPWSRRLRGARADDPPGETWWRACLWLGIWIVIPTVAVAYLSLKHRVGAEDLLRGAGDWLARPWLRKSSANSTFPGLLVLESRAFFIIAAGILIAATTLLWRYIPRVLAATTGYAVVVTLVLLHMEFDSLLPLINPTQPAHEQARNTILLGLLVLLPPLLWYFSGPTVSRRMVRSGQFIGVVAGLFGLWWLVDLAIPHPLKGPVWMPRYLAFIWPGVAVAACALLVRLPTRPLRYAAIAFVLGINLLQSGARVFAGNEPPLAQVSADILADFHGDEVLTFTPPLQDTRNVRFSGSPGTGTVLYQRMTTHPAGRYYLLRGAQTELSPQVFKRAHPFSLLNMRPAGLPGMIAAEAANHPTARRLIVWHQLPVDPPAEADDPLARALGPDWQIASQQMHKVRFFWSWADLYTFRRREYERTSPAGTPTTQPAPATQPPPAPPR